MGLIKNIHDVTSAVKCCMTALCLIFSLSFNAFLCTPQIEESHRS